MDDPIRDKPASTPDEWDDDAEYEVEPPDADVVAAEERRAKEAVEATRRSIDIDEIYRDVDRDRGREILEGLTRDFQFRFQVKHLLIATAVLAIVLTLWRLELLGTALVILVMLSVAGLYLYLQWQEKKHRDEADRRRQEMYARRRNHGEQRSGPKAPDEIKSDEKPVAAAPPLPNEADELWQESLAREKFRFRFSLREMMLAITAAALILGLVHALGGAANAATLLGFVALIGLVIHALGFEPPEIVVLGWWLILVMYVLLSIVAAVWSGFA